jgi:GTP-binding protein HflX
VSRRHENRGRRRLTATEVDLDVLQQRALLVGVDDGSHDDRGGDDLLSELALLVDTAGAEPVGEVSQRRDGPDPRTYVGSGKLTEIKDAVGALDVDVVVVDGELSPAQQRTLEQQFGVDVVDRVALILDIFAQHARSQEGMLQVELAQLRYRLPRLRGRGVTMSQQATGVGAGRGRLATRGPGETQLEVDRRRIQRRITKLERDLEQLGRTRTTQRKARRRSGKKRAALVGYTNAGKSTLLNRLTDAAVLVEDRLFSTLDPTTRRLHLPAGEPVLVSDTVGFVRRLPHQLVEAFRSTLEEVADADLLLHVVDVKEPDLGGHLRAVRDVLAEIGAADVPSTLVWNKIDIADPLVVKRLLADHPGSVAVSGVTGEGVGALRERIAKWMHSIDPVVELLVPYDHGDVLAGVHATGEVIVESHGPEGTRLRARIPKESVARFASYRVE